MGKVISFNGVDGSGKTTQIELLLSKYNQYIDLVNSQKAFANEKIADFNWWFVESIPEEFLDTLYKCIKQRNELIKQSKKDIVLLDKGIKNFDARAIATLMIKGVEEEEAIQMIEKIKNKYEIDNKENLALFFEIAKSSEERQKITRERKTESLDGNSFDIYSLYQKYQNQIIYNQIMNNDYKVFDATGTIEEVNKKLVKVVFDKD